MLEGPLSARAPRRVAAKMLLNLRRGWLCRSWRSLKSFVFNKRTNSSILWLAKRAAIIQQRRRAPSQPSAFKSNPRTTRKTTCSCLTVLDVPEVNSPRLRGPCSPKRLHKLQETNRVTDTTTWWRAQSAWLPARTKMIASCITSHWIALYMETKRT